MFRFLAALVLSVSLIAPANAGLLKWGLRGAVACEVTGACSGLASKGVESLGAVLLERYGSRLVEKCLTSPPCLRMGANAMKALAGGAGAGVALQQLDHWMAKAGGTSPPSANKKNFTSAASTPPDPDDPFEHEERSAETKTKANQDGSNKEAPIFGKNGDKLDYLLGKATGRTHNIERSTSMEAMLKRIGLNDTSTTRSYLEAHLKSVYYDESNIVKIGEKGWVTKESLLQGPGGSVKLVSQWNGRNFISAIVEGQPLKGAKPWNP